MVNVAELDVNVEVVPLRVLVTTTVYAPALKAVVVNEIEVDVSPEIATPSFCHWYERTPPSLIDALTLKVTL